MSRLIRRVPLAGWMCAVVAFLNAAAWGLLTPVFHVPDEPQHIAYAQYFAETGRPPTDPDRPAFSTEESTAYELLRFDHVAGNERGRPPWAGVPIKERVAADLASDDGGGLTNAASNPPTYYALQAIPYWLSSGGSFFDQVLFMRVLSAVLAAITVLFCFAFVREVMPGTPWAWGVGALAVAFQPVFGFIGGGVISDNLLFAFSAMTLYLLARAFRRGATLPWALALGGVVAAGLLTKGIMLGLVPAALLGTALLAWRSGPLDHRRTVRIAAGASGCALIALLGYLAVSEVAWNRALYPGTETLSSGPAGQGRSVSGLIEYAWQFYLPRLPFMEDQWLGIFPLYDVWFRGFVGRFGWLDYGFPSWVYTFALCVTALLATLVLARVIRNRRPLQRRWAELMTYVTAVVGLAGLVAIAGYGYRADTGDVFEQARYLFPLLPLYATFIAVAARGAGKNGPIVGAGIVLVTIAHQIFALLLTIARYYG